MSYASLSIVLVSLTCAGTASAQRLTLEPLYSEAQVASGKQSYDRYCAECHHMTLKGTGHGPELAGPNFLAKWGEKTVAELFTQIQTGMPAAAPHSLPESTYVAITAHVLRVNGAASGDKDLRADSKAFIGRAILGDKWDPATAKAAGALSGATKWESWHGAGTIAGDAERAAGFVNREVADFKPVTGAMLSKPPAADWLSWRRTLDGQGYSPLDQINRRNVKNLKLAWALTMREGSNQVTPLVHDGVMYLTHPGNVIQAVDAATGELIWEYSYAYPPESKTLGGPTRNIALYQDKLFLSTYDAAVVALDARTGKQLWRTVKADYNKGFTHTAGPLIADGVVISGHANTPADASRAEEIVAQYLKKAPVVNLIAISR